jgi:UPF0755 protein
MCLGTATGILGWLELTDRVKATFGPASPNLSLTQTMRLTIILFLNSEKLTQPASSLDLEQPLIVVAGESPPYVAANLESQGLISDASAFTAFLQYAGLDTTLQAGDYLLSPVMSPLEIARALQDPTPKEVDFTVLEGWRLEEIADSLPTSGLEISPQQFLDATRQPPAGYPFLDELAPGQSMEGFLFPGSYELARESSVSQVLISLLDNFSVHITPEIETGIQRQGLSMLQAVILASIVEREAIVEDEMPMLASVFLNRLVAGIPLEADSTVQYALGYNESQKTWWTNPLSSRDLEFDSPYNTYRYPGLPPGPIANPGLNALEAVAFPADTPYYYFRATCDGSGRHTFAETFQEHLENACPEPSDVPGTP